MGDRHKGTIGRRQLLRTGFIGIVATAARLPPTPKLTTKNARLAFRQTPPRFKTSTESTATQSVRRLACS